MKCIFIVLVSITLSLSFNTFAQNCNDLISIENDIDIVRVTAIPDSMIISSGAYKLIDCKDSVIAKELAVYDIERGTPFLHLGNNSIPTIYAEQILFESKYKVYYYRHGCSVIEEDIIEVYNRIIFNYIYNKFGSNCIKEIKGEVIGLKHWYSTKFHKIVHQKTDYEKLNFSDSIIYKL